MISVLLVDDDCVEKKLVEAYLSRHLGERYSLHHATSPADARKLLENQPFDCIFLDNRLNPYGNVSEYFETLNIDQPAARIFVISASVDDFDCLSPPPPGVERVISKFDLGREIENGLVG